MSAIPFNLRANDVQRHVINVDSRFRDSPNFSSPCNFYMTLLSPIRNIIRVRITSFEFPNSYYHFSERRHNTSFQVIYHAADGTAMGKPFYIPDGNYTAIELEEELNAQFTEAGGLNWLSVRFNVLNGHFVFTGTQRFAIDTPFNGYERDTDYGLGYYMGFTRKLHKANKVGETAWTVESDCQSNFAGDTYVLMNLNGYKCVAHRMEDTQIDVFAKFIIREQKNFMTFDDYSSHLIKEVVFPAPHDLTRLHVQILDPYGEVLDIGCNNFSFSIEVMEIKNPSLYNTIRNSLGQKYDGEQTI